MATTLKEKYDKQLTPALMKELDCSNTFQVPKVQKVVINIGVGEAGQNAKLLDAVLEELTQISGQKAIITRAKKSIAGFKVREGVPIGVMVTLRGKRMYDFLNKLICIAMPRIRDFRGVSERGFDGHGNFNIGLKDQLIFPEIVYEKVSQVRGMNISIVTTAKTDREAKALLTHLGVPFRKPQQQHAKAG